MFKIIAVTNRHLCHGSVAEQIERIAKIDKPDRVILREKDLSEEEYEQVAIDVMKVCSKNDIECIMHTYIQVAIGLHCRNIHLPVSTLQGSKKYLNYFEVIGVSIHSVEEAVWAEQSGATYLTAGHIFATDCKKGVPPRGIEFLKKVCDVVDIPIYAIGGIQKENIPLLKSAGASGACFMSEFMNQR